MPTGESAKKSFKTDRFPEVREALLDYFRWRGPFDIKVGHVVKHQGMLWLDIVRTPELLKVHEEIDARLKIRFGIPRHKFDRRFEPHISLFTDRDDEKIAQIYEAIREEFEPDILTVKKIVVGADRERDTFLEL